MSSFVLRYFEQPCKAQRRTGVYIDRSGLNELYLQGNCSRYKCSRCNGYLYVRR